MVGYIIHDGPSKRGRCEAGARAKRDAGGHAVEFTTLKVAGVDAVRLLNEHRARFRATGQYPFLIGDARALAQITEAAGFNKTEPADILRGSLEVDISDWIGARRKDVEGYGLVLDELLGEWPDGIAQPGSIGIHKDVL